MSFSIDTSALRSSVGFRWLFTGHTLSYTGSQITMVALAFQVWQLTHSPLAVGAIGLAQVLPTMGFALYGGAIADAIDRRRLLVTVQFGSLTVSVLLALLAAHGSPPLWTLYTLAALGSGFASLDGPARTAAMPMLVESNVLRSAVQLREVMTQSGRLLGPAVGGLIIGKVGLAAAYWTDAATFTIALLCFMQLPSLSPQLRTKPSLQSIIDGLKYVGSSPVLASTFIADLIAMVIGMPRAVFPALALSVFHVGSFGLGMLYSAIAGGAVAGLLVGGWMGRVKRAGRAVVIAVALWGVAIGCVGLTDSFAVAVVLLALAGAADMVSAVFRQTILLETVPDEFRGRMGSVHIMVVTGGPPLGDAEAGLLASLVGVQPAIVVSGIACVVGMGVLAAAIPSFARWRSTTATG
jgi:MFS family permease